MTPSADPARPRPPALAAAALALLPLVTAACTEAPPELEVAGITWSESELLGLAEERKLVLGELAGLGKAVAEGEAASLASPLVERDSLEFLARVHRADLALDSAGVGDEVLRARYRTDPALELTVRHLLVLSERHETEEQRRAARADAERALERIRAGEPFPEVVAEVSEEPGAAERGGLLQPGREGSWVPEFWAAARALDPGEVSAVTETQYGFHVLRLEARDTVPFEEVRPTVALEVARLMAVELDPYAAMPGFEPDVPGDAVPAAIGDSSPGSEDPLARFLATLPGPRWERVVSSPDSVAAVARRHARLREAARRAAASGATVPPGVTASARQGWNDALTRWSYVFGFEEGMSDATLHDVALEALGATGQGPGTAREELHLHGPLIRLRYPVELADEAGEPR